MREQREALCCDTAGLWCAGVGLRASYLGLNVCLGRDTVDGSYVFLSRKVLVEHETREERLGFGRVREAVEALDCDIVCERRNIVSEITYRP